MNHDLSQERARVAALAELSLVEEPPDPALHDLVRIASALCSVPIAAVSLVDERSHWLKACFGLELGHAPREDAFCSHTILSSDLFVVPDALADPRFAESPFVTSGPRIRFYAGVPLMLPSGHAVGAFCLMDRHPRTLSTELRETLHALKRQVEVHLALRVRFLELRRAKERIEALQGEKDRLLQFVIHDMNNSLATIVMSADELVSRPAAADDAQEIGSDVAEAAQRLERLVADLMDIGRSEAGGEMSVARSAQSLGALFSLVRESFARQANAVGVGFLVEPTTLEAHADSALLSRVLANLVDNAIRHAPRGTDVTMRAEVRESDVVVSVADEGPGIVPARRESIFDLFDQGGEENQRRGRALGLAFCRAAISAHGGRTWVEPNEPRGSRFCFSLPLAS